MKKIVLVLVTVSSFFSSAAFADLTYAIEAGIRQQSGDTDVTGYSTKSQMGFQFGASAVFPISGPWNLRTGMLYTQRPLVLENDTTSEEIKVSMNYLDVPLQVMYKFEDYAGVFIGTSLAFNIDNSSDNKTAFKTSDVETPFLPIVFGASFKFAPQLGATLYFESGSSIAKDLSNYRAVGANLLVTFD